MGCPERAATAPAGGSVAHATAAAQGGADDLPALLKQGNDIGKQEVEIGRRLLDQFQRFLATFGGSKIDGTE